jgi:DinB superfamily
MNKQFVKLLATRQNLLKILETTSTQDLLAVPDGYNNNIFWNIAHCVATQQLLCYYLSGNAFKIDDFWIEKYKKGTFANLSVPQEDFENLKFILIRTAELLQNDYNQGLFADYKVYPTSYGITLNDIEDAIEFNNIHEGMHLGYILAQKRALQFQKQP